MADSVHLLAQSILGKASLEECELPEIKQLVERYPYFAPAQFLLLQKLKQQTDPSHHVQLQKAVLYYHNPLAFEYFIDSDRFHTDVNLDKKPAIEQLPEQEIEQSPVHQPEEDVVVENAITEEAMNDEVWEAKQPEVIEQETTEMIAEAEVESATVNEETTATIQIPEVTRHDVWNDEVIEAKQPEIIEQESPEVISQTEVESSTANEETTLINQIPEAPSQEESRHEEIPQPTTSNVEPQISNPKPETELAFEPYHTVDYFASQGIKLSQEEVPKDKFGKQLKSFTEWLKTMKRVPANQISKADTTTVEKVEHMAEDSVHNPDVVTEAMAEVWLKQGNREKAMETYNKLSLLNPSKRAYFATLIENLKR